jgi:hypothetical protein
VRVSMDTDAVARIMAWGQRRGVLIRSTSNLSPDPEEVFGVALIRVIGEERVQAVAYGLISGSPTITSAVNPIDRDASFLGDLGDALYEYISDTLSAGQLPRLWFADDITLRTLDLLGHRYRNNQSASESVRRLGRLCTILVDQTSYSGDQVIAIATRALSQHLRTGQSAADDYHLSAQLPWLNAPAGVDPTELVQRSGTPAAGAMLDRQSDNVVERLRRQAVSPGARGAAARSELLGLLESGVRREWDTLQQGRGAFRGLGLPPCPGIERLVVLSRNRLEQALARPWWPASSIQARSLILLEMEYAYELADSIDIRGDSIAREQAVQQGRVIRGVVRAVLQPKPGRLPCTVVIDTEQQVLRARSGTVLQDRTGIMQGRVVISGDNGDSSGTIRILLTRGVRAAAYLRIGQPTEWDDAVVTDLRYLYRQIYGRLAKSRPQALNPDRLSSINPPAQLSSPESVA